MRPTIARESERRYDMAIFGIGREGIGFLQSLILMMNWVEAL